MGRGRSQRTQHPTEEPTPRRLADARRQGLVAEGADLRGAAALAAVFLVLVGLGPSMIGQLTSSFASALARAARADSFDVAAGAAARSAFAGALRVLALPVAAAFLVTLIVGLLQTGGLWVAPAWRPDLGRLSPTSGLRRLWAGSTLVQAGLGVVKVAILALVAVATLGPLLPALGRLAGAPAARVLAGFGVTAQRLGGRLVVAALGLGVADYLMARGRHRRGLRMTRQEIKQEQREREGDPAHRAERLRLVREAAALWTIDEVRRADLVVTSGADTADAIAVALRYDAVTAAARAPIVVAVARRLVAARLLAGARAAHVPVFGDTALARALADRDAGDEIGADSFDAVAELLRITIRPPAMTDGASPKRA